MGDSMPAKSQAAPIFITHSRWYASKQIESQSFTCACNTPVANNKYKHNKRV